MTTQASSLQEAMIGLVRAFGWHRPSETPCGQPLSMSEAYALLTLSQTAPLTQNELAAALDLRKSTTSRLVQALVKRSWIQRQRHQDDGRAFIVSLTSDGEKMASQIAKARAHTMSLVLENIPASKRRSVVESLHILIGAINDRKSSAE